MPPYSPGYAPPADLGPAPGPGTGSRAGAARVAARTRSIRLGYGRPAVRTARIPRRVDRTVRRWGEKARPYFTVRPCPLDGRRPRAPGMTLPPPAPGPPRPALPAPRGALRGVFPAPAAIPSGGGRGSGRPVFGGAAPSLTTASRNCHVHRRKRGKSWLCWQ
ncbi:hypothetical protein GCM10010211_48260 [Streptomyces albospinus]|uniref:Uncharacterized protein n=1 Tax=Streptomyces albospinus TaxID=285515 RepID=A0ABQ2VCQ4_9ACTN|nr:hypothetical protein GCM10010211_48260 [Streptomyces albospinus]